MGGTSPACDSVPLVDDLALRWRGEESVECTVKRIDPAVVESGLCEVAAHRHRKDAVQAQHAFANDVAVPIVVPVQDRDLQAEPLPT